MRLDELDFELPDELIAQEPLEQRDGARMLVVAPSGPVDSRIVDLASQLPPSLFVLNNTRVIPARFVGNKVTGGRAEVLLVERDEHTFEQQRTAQDWLAMGRGLKPGVELVFGSGPTLAVKVVSKSDGPYYRVQLQSDAGVDEAIRAIGAMPLPPYIRRPADENDRERYQTVFAEVDGAVAAPTAGLHLTHALMDELKGRGHRFAHVTLHVGPGTFAPVKVDDLAEHPMHRESYDVPDQTVRAIAAARADGLPVLAVGTTVVRTLEAASTGTPERNVLPGPGSTDLLIQPPYRFQVVDALLTNFHLPKSTLLALVMALAGEDAVREAYAHAVTNRYRFFSYGDAMLIPPVQSTRATSQP